MLSTVLQIICLSCRLMESKHQSQSLRVNHVSGFLSGAVAARLRIFDTGLTLIVAHLSSGEQEGDELKRNYDYSEIVRRGQFPTDSPNLDPESVQAGPSSDVKVAGSGKAPGQWGKWRGLLDTAQVVWMGDLNYRLSMPDAQVPTCSGQAGPVCILNRKSSQVEDKASNAFAEAAFKRALASDLNLQV